MNKTRVEAFSDAVLAIILTIMVLEIKIPDSTHLGAMLEELPYIISYGVGWLFIGVAWYNHHYMFSKTKVVTKQIFWANNFWMFTTSFVPVATAWIGKSINSRGPQIFYSIIYTLWTVAYIVLSYSILNANKKAGHLEVADSIRNMPIFSLMTSWKIILLQIIVWLLIIIYLPALQIVMVAVLVLFYGGKTNSDSDKLYK
ncbi:TMEM175 family protein [Lactobacillus terrae]|uniref:TMEM175 family protein n=1 Tax=Lactobacillus terrae TaxID=2269374 RepID=UPI000C1B6477|nr:TMEM175 family protein [Lactobacillus terrae]